MSLLNLIRTIEFREIFHLFLLLDGEDIHFFVRYMASDLAILLQKKDTSRFCVGRTPSSAVNPAVAQRLGPLIERCPTLQSVDLHLAHMSVDALRILLRYLAKSKSVTTLNVVGGLSILQAKVLGNGLSQFVGQRRFCRDGGFGVVLEPIQFDDLLASLVVLGLERSTAITSFAIRPLNKVSASASVAKVRLRLSSILQRNRSRYHGAAVQQQPHKHETGPFKPAPPPGSQPVFVRESVHTPDPVCFARRPLQFTTPSATPVARPASDEPHQPCPPDYPRQCCASITNLASHRFLQQHSSAVVMDQLFHKIPTPPLATGGNTPTVRHPSPPQLNSHELIANFNGEADRAKQFFLDFACREHERFLVATEELCTNMTECMSSLVHKYTELAQQKASAAAHPATPPKSYCRRPVQHYARIIHQG